MCTDFSKVLFTQISNQLTQEKCIFFCFDNESKMNVLSQDDSLGNVSYSFIGCGTLAHWHLGPETVILSIEKKREKQLPELLAELWKINHNFELAFKNVWIFIF